MLNSALESKKRGLTSIGFILMVCAVAFAIIFAVPEKAQAATYIDGFKTASNTTSSLTLTWDKFTNASSYTLRWIDATEDIKDASKYKKQSFEASCTSWTINGLKPGTLYGVYLDCTLNTGQSGTIALAAISTRVAKPTGVKQTKWSYKTSTASFTWDIQTGASQIECKLVDATSGKKILSKTFYSLVTDFTATLGRKNIMYAVQMRVKDANGWSAWSDKMYFLSQPLTKNAKTKVAKNRLTVTWDKVKGAQKYAVYVSTKAKSGYKKVATVKSTKGSTVVKKFAGKKFSPKKTYYVYVQATKKVGGKTYTSGKHYACKVKGSKASMVYPF